MNRRHAPGADALSRLHPALSLVFFLGAIVFTMALRHPAYVAVSAVAGGCCYLALTGRQAFRTFAGLAVVFVLISGLDPLFNPRGDTSLFALLGRPYTLESLCFGMAAAGMFVAALEWFFCFSLILTGDKLTALLGRRLPALSLLLVMVLRLVPHVRLRAEQVVSARRCIGLAGGGSLKGRICQGMASLSALTAWMLEGSVVTADSMRARGYGTGPRTSCQARPFRRWEIGALVLLLGLISIVLAGAIGGCARCDFFPALTAAPVQGAGAAVLAVYTLWLLLPTILNCSEAIAIWHCLRSRT